MKRTFLFSIALLLALINVTVQGESTQPMLLAKADQTAMNQWVEQQMSSMTPDERIAQLFVLAVSAENDSLTRERVRYCVEGCKVGGFIFHEGNATELATLINYAQSLSKVPLMMTIDGEWGLSMRLKDTPQFPRNLVLGAIDDDRLLYQYGREVAREMRRIGLHVNFAPVLDVNDTPSNPVIGDRSFGESPELVSRHAIAYARGLEDGQVLSVGKHFPGHGSSIEDSHKTLPLIDKSIDEMSVCEFIPFRDYINAGLSGLLTAHLYVPAIDKTEMATTMSSRCVTTLLKERMGFNGLIFTDALGMEGAKKNLDGSPCVKALLAGNDIMLMPANADEEVNAVRQAIDNGTLTQALIDERCRKMLRYKFALGLFDTKLSDIANIPSDINSGNASALIHQLTAASITVIKNQNALLPVSQLNKHHIALVTMGITEGEKAMLHRRADHYAQVTHFNLQPGENTENITSKLANGKFDIVVMAVNDNNGELVNAVKAITDKSANVVLVVMNKPYDIAPYGNVLAHRHVKSVLLTYDNNELTQDYAIQTIFGGNAAKGILPISVSCGERVLEPGRGLHYQACRLGFALPFQVGVNDRLLQQIDSVAMLGVKEKAFPGCQVVVARHGQIICCRSYGEINFGSGVAVDDNTLFGLASVSKATGTLSAVMKVYDNGKFDLDDPASKFIPGLQNSDKQDLTFRELLYHETGMPPSLNMWTMMMDPTTYSGKLFTNQQDNLHTIYVMRGAWGHKDARLRTDILSTTRTNRFNIAIADGIWGGKVTYDSIMARIYNVNLGQKKYVYSCLNFSLLADAMQRITHTPLNTYVDQQIFGPLGAYHTVYRPLERFSRDQIAYTEMDTYLRRQHIHGYVHDELAAFSGGVQGNAGLFSNAVDLAKLFQMWLNGGTYGGTRLLSAETVKTFTTEKSPNSHRGLGFDKPVVDDPKASNTCDEASPETFGHTGFTGTCFWVDPKNDMFYIFLSNRVCPTRDNPNFTRISARSRIHSLIYRNLLTK